MSEQAPNTYTTDEICAVLAETLNDPGQERLVIDGLKAHQEQRLAEAQAQEHQQQIIDIVELHHRTSGSTSNIEGVFEDLEESSLIFLRASSENATPSSLERLAAEAAATAFIYMTAQTGDFTDTNKKILEDSQVDIDQIIGQYRRGVKRAWGVEDDSPEDKALRANLTTLDSLAKHLYMHLGPEEWKLIVDPPMLRLRQAALDEGLQLRELNKSGKYDDEEM